MPGQYYDWTCSACATEWTIRALGLPDTSDIYTNRENVTYSIGYPTNINPQYGLMDGSGAQLQRVIKEETGRDSEQSWGLSFDDAYALGASGTPALFSGAAWYHWVALRGVQGDTLYIANSAPGYKSVWSNLSRSDWNRLGGFSVVWLV